MWLGFGSAYAPVCLFYSFPLPDAGLCTYLHLSESAPGSVYSILHLHIYVNLIWFCNDFGPSVLDLTDVALLQFGLHRTETLSRIEFAL